MANWREEYLSSLKDKDLSNPVNMELVQACSQLADRVSSLEAEKAAFEAQTSTTRAASATSQKQSGNGTNASDDPGSAQLRLDLAEAIRSRGVSDVRLRAAEEELDKLRAKTKSDAQTLRSLNTEKATLTTRLSDREHELREKRKLLENVQDEMIALNLQLSVSEKERDKVRKENKDLVDRWMRRMGQEADAMNLANEHSPRDR